MLFKNVKDMREANQKFLRLDKYSEFSDPIDLLSTVFKEQIPC
jgi:CTD small phosphatase-like protein 2